MTSERLDRCRFGPFRLDCAERTLHHGGELVELRDKAFELLVLLLRRAPRLVETAAIRSALWPGLTVHENNLAVTVSALRRALKQHEPTTYLETVPRHGYRWAGAVEWGDVGAGEVGERALADVELAPAVRTVQHGLGEPFVGRERELAWLLEHWRAAATGSVRLVFVSGEPGIGKTRLLAQLAVRALEVRPEASVLRGACFELFGAVEPYLPWLAACRAAVSGPQQRAWLSVLRRHAPAWYRRLRGDELERGSGAEAASGWQLVDALLAAGRERPVLVVLEDVHWADASSIDVLRLLDAAAGPARLLVVASQRPAELRQHAALRSLSNDLAARLRCCEQRLVGWGADEVEAYLQARFGRREGQRADALELWRRTEGLPFFVARLADDLGCSDGGEGEQGSMPLSAMSQGVPAGVSALIRRQLERVPAERRRLLEAASIAGSELSTTLLARALSLLPAAIEAELELLATVDGLLERAGEEELGDGAVSVRYRFGHALVQQHVYDGIESHRRRQLHLAMARAFLAQSASGAAGTAEAGVMQAGVVQAGAAGVAPAGVPRSKSEPRPALLAAHFERAGELRRAVAFWTEAGDQAERAHAKSEALDCYARAEELLAQLPVAERGVRSLFVRYGQGWANFNLRRFQLAERQFVEVARLAQQLNDPRTVSAEQRALALEYFTRPWADELVQRPAQLSSAERAEELAVELQAEALYCRCLMACIGDQAAVLPVRARELLELSRSGKAGGAEAEALSFLGLHAKSMGDMQRARALFEQALRLAVERGQRRAEELAVEQLAELHLWQTELEPARDRYAEVLERVPTATAIAGASIGLAEALAKLGQVREAIAA